MSKIIILIGSKNAIKVSSNTKLHHHFSISLPFSFDVFNHPHPLHFYFYCHTFSLNLFRLSNETSCSSSAAIIAEFERNMFHYQRIISLLGARKKIMKVISHPSNFNYVAKYISSFLYHTRHPFHYTYYILINDLSKRDLHFLMPHKAKHKLNFSYCFPLSEISISTFSVYTKYEA